MTSRSKRLVFSAKSDQLKQFMFWLWILVCFLIFKDAAWPLEFYDVGGRVLFLLCASLPFVLYFCSGKSVIIDPVKKTAQQGYVLMKIPVGSPKRGVPVREVFLIPEILSSLSESKEAAYSVFAGVAPEDGAADASVGKSLSEGARRSAIAGSAGAGIDVAEESGAEKPFGEGDSSGGSDASGILSEERNREEGARSGGFLSRRSRARRNPVRRGFARSGFARSGFARNESGPAYRRKRGKESNSGAGRFSSRRQRENRKRQEGKSRNNKLYLALRSDIASFKKAESLMRGLARRLDVPAAIYWGKIKPSTSAEASSAEASADPRATAALADPAAGAATERKTGADLNTPFKEPDFVKEMEASDLEKVIAKKKRELAAKQAQGPAPSKNSRQKKRLK